jgi:hypothetical protein
MWDAQWFTVPPPKWSNHESHQPFGLDGLGASSLPQQPLWGGVYPFPYPFPMAQNRCGREASQYFMRASLAKCRDALKHPCRDAFWCAGAWVVVPQNRSKIDQKSIKNPSHMQVCFRLRFSLPFCSLFFQMLTHQNH